MGFSEAFCPDYPRPATAGESYYEASRRAIFSRQNGGIQHRMVGEKSLYRSLRGFERYRCLQHYG
jgi:hypothetical protein